MISDAIGIKLLGKVHGDVLGHPALLRLPSADNRGWFFVDYSSVDVPLNTRFDALFAGAEHGLLPETPAIELWGVVDQLGNVLTEIPKGYKVFAFLDFGTKIPDAIEALPELKTWSHNAAAITLAQRNAIRLEDRDPVEEDEYKLISLFIAYQFPDKLIGKTEFINALSTSFNVRKSSVERIVSNLQSLGYLKEKDQDTLELLTKLPPAS